MKLMTSQKDAVFDIIIAAGLAPSQFQWEEAGSRNVTADVATILRYVGTEYKFAFETGLNTPSHNAHYAIYSPGKFAYEESDYPGNWQGQLYTLGQWLDNLRREINSPNKWERLQTELDSLNFRFDDDRTKFSAQEFEDVKVKIENLKESLNRIGLLPEEVATINSKLDHLTEMAVVLNKFDWKSLFIGTIISIVIQLNVTPDNAKALWSLINTVFNSYFLLP